jgi:hypothetical protein
MMDSPIMRLANRGALTWAALLAGIERGWVTQDDVARAAVDWLSKHPEANDKPIILLAACERDDARDVRSWLEEANEAAGHEAGLEPLERWRWAFLADLADNNHIDDDAKLQRLQELYAEFGYPEDMAECSVYVNEPGLALGDIVKCPLEAMREVVSLLEGRICG